MKFIPEHSNRFRTIWLENRLTVDEIAQMFNLSENGVKKIRQELGLAPRAQNWKSQRGNGHERLR